MLRVKPVFWTLAAIALGGGVLVGVTATGARADGTLCGYSTAPAAGGTYMLQNDEWGSTATECITPDGAGFAVTSSEISNPTDGDPGGYPSIYMGCHYGDCTTGGLGAHPLLLSDIKPGQVTSSWYTSQPGGSDNAYDVAYDIWINKTPTTSGAPDGTEVMVWLNHDGSIQPAGSLVASGVWISGHRFNVWYGSGGTADIVTYEMTTGRTSVANLDIGAFIRNAGQRGYTEASWYLISVEAGFEVWQGGVGLATDDFSVDLLPNKPGVRS